MTSFPLNLRNHAYVKRLVEILAESDGDLPTKDGIQKRRPTCLARKM